MPDAARHAWINLCEKYEIPLLRIMYTCFETTNACQWIMLKTIDISWNGRTVIFVAKVNSFNLTEKS